MEEKILKEIVSKNVALKKYFFSACELLCSFQKIDRPIHDVWKHLIKNSSEIIWDVFFFWTCVDLTEMIDNRIQLNKRLQKTFPKS